MINLSNAVKDALQRHQLEETDLLCLQISDEVLDRICLLYTSDAADE